MPSKNPIPDFVLNTKPISFYLTNPGHRRRASFVKLPPGNEVSHPQQWRDFWVKNLDLAIKVFKTIPHDRHQQATWICDLNQHECKTVGCALGWFAMSGKFPGLDWVVSNGFLARPGAAINGWRTDWQEAGYIFFSPQAQRTVFNMIDLNHAEVVGGLTRVLNHFKTTLPSEQSVDPLTEVPSRYRRKNPAIVAAEKKLFGRR